jgi:GT2 family glycosyltransferase
MSTPNLSSSAIEAKSVKLAVIIVSWNVCELLAGCLRSVQADLAGSGLTGQIWVVDNASQDGSVAILRRDFPDVHLIASDTNLGFAGGNNAALRALGFGSRAEDLPEAVLLLNPDTIVHLGALFALYDFLQRHPRVGVAGARLVYGDGSFQHGAFDFPGLWQLAIELLPVPGRLVESRLNGRYPHTRYEDARPFRIGHPLGAVMCVRREAIQQAGLLDEGYHMYVEEVDWSRRIRLAGWEAYCVPAAVVTHLGGQSTGQIKVSSFVNLWASRYRFYRHYYSPLKLWLARQIVSAGMQRKAGHDLRAARQGQLPAAELEERLAGYHQVKTIWQGKHA